MAPPPAHSLPRGVLFTAFEPSGDDHAAAVIAGLKALEPDLPIFAWGGPKMQAAGANIVEFTGESAVMGLPGFKKILEHQRINKRIARWLSGEGGELVGLHVPVDSPAANFPICRIAKARGLRVVHMVAPQVWAWASWRIRKLRRLTDLVLCLLPFEESWFLARGVPARFIGHPLFDQPLDMAAIGEHAATFPGGHGAPKLALMPGSRPAEMERCFPVLLDAFRRLKKDFPQTTAIVAATNPRTADRLREIASAASGDEPGAAGLPPDVAIISGATDAVVHWCDYALVVSGTVTLQIAKQYKPMVALYRPNKLVFQLLGRWLVSTELFTLPNLVAGRRAVPELIPHFSDSGEDLAVEVIKFMRRTNYADDQREALKAVCARFEQAQQAAGGAGPAAAKAIVEMLDAHAAASRPVQA